MIYTLISYLKFLWRSSNQHGVHSPFVYDLVTRCFYDQQQFPEYENMVSHRNALLKSNEWIDVTDFGAGSKVFSSNRRKVATVAKNAGITRKRQRLLFRMVKYLNANHILELGTSLGMGTLALGSGNPKATITTVEGCPETLQTARKYSHGYLLDTIEFVNLSFESYFDNLDDATKFDLIYIDGDHSKAGTLDYFHRVLKQVHNHSVCIFDDIHWSPDMKEAWDEICAHPQVTVSIDTFFWGIIFFRKEQRKQHFNIRL